MDHSLELSSSQRKVLKEFYRGPAIKVAFDKKERKKIWNEFKEDRNIKKYVYLEKNAPAIFAELNKSLENKKKMYNLQFLASAYMLNLWPINLVFQYLKITLIMKV